MAWDVKKEILFKNMKRVSNQSLWTEPFEKPGEWSKLVEALVRETPTIFQSKVCLFSVDKSEVTVTYRRRNEKMIVFTFRIVHYRWRKL